MAYLKTHFVTKDAGRHRYFLENEISHNIQGGPISQRKYALNILQETEVLGCKHVRTPMDADTDLWDESGPLLENVTQYKRLVGSLFISL